MKGEPARGAHPPGLSPSCLGPPSSSHLPNGDDDNRAMSVKRELFSSSCRNVLNGPLRSVLDEREQEAKRPLSLESLSDGGARQVTSQEVPYRQLQGAEGRGP